MQRSVTFSSNVVSPIDGSADDFFGSEESDDEFQEETAERNSFYMTGDLGCTFMLFLCIYEWLPCSNYFFYQKHPNSLLKWTR